MLIWLVDFQEVAKRFPSLSHIVFQELAGWDKRL
jgi:hypothetical protein